MRVVEIRRSPESLKTVALRFGKPPRMIGLGRFELPTHGLGNRCSIHLSYRPSMTLLDRDPNENSLALSSHRRHGLPSGEAHVIAPGRRRLPYFRESALQGREILFF